MKQTWIETIHDRTKGKNMILLRGKIHKSKHDLFSIRAERFSKRLLYKFHESKKSHSKHNAESASSHRERNYLNSSPQPGEVRKKGFNQGSQLFQSPPKGWRKQRTIQIDTKQYYEWRAQQYRKIISDYREEMIAVSGKSCTPQDIDASGHNTNRSEAEAAVNHTLAAKNADHRMIIKQNNITSSCEVRDNQENTQNTSSKNTSSIKTTINESALKKTRLKFIFDNWCTVVTQEKSFGQVNYNSASESAANTPFSNNESRMNHSYIQNGESRCKLGNKNKVSTNKSCDAVNSKMVSKKGRGIFKYNCVSKLQSMSKYFKTICFNCCKEVIGRNVVQHLLFVELKCIVCKLNIKTCREYRKVKMANVRCSAKYLRHKFERRKISLMDSLESKIKKYLQCKGNVNSNPAENILDEMDKYTKNLSRLYLLEPWKEALAFIKSNLVIRQALMGVVRQETGQENVQMREIGLQYQDADAIQGASLSQTNCVGISLADLMPSISSLSVWENGCVDRPMQLDAFGQEVNGMVDKLEEPDVRTNTGESGMSLKKLEDPKSKVDVNEEEVIKKKEEPNVNLKSMEDPVSAVTEEELVIQRNGDNLNGNLFSFQISDHSKIHSSIADKRGPPNVERNNTSHEEEDVSDLNITHEISNIISESKQATVGDLNAPHEISSMTRKRKQSEAMGSFRDEKESDIESDDYYITYYFPTATIPDECPMCYEDWTGHEFEFSEADVMASGKCKGCGLKIYCKYENLKPKKTCKRRKRIFCKRR